MRILYIDLDCLRSDHVGANGYRRNTTPNLDRIAGEGVTFTSAYCSNSPCVPSRASLFSGRFGINNGVVAHHGVGEVYRPNCRPSLQEHLWKNGFKTVSFSSFLDRHSAWWFGCGWEELHTHTQKKGQESADEVNAAFLPWFKEHAKEDNWFIHLHYWDIHSHYRCPDEWANHRWDEPAPDWPDEEAIQRNMDIYGPRAAQDIWTGYGRWMGAEKSVVPSMPDDIKTRADFEKLINAYDNAIRYADYHVGQVLDLMEEQGILEDTVIIVSGDHGDSFGEHGQYMDHGIANEAVHNIPMIVRWPGVTEKPVVSDAMIYGLDLGPTLCDMLGTNTPAGWDGRSFAPALRGEEFSGWPYQVWDHGIYTFTRAVRTRDWLLIRFLHPGCYNYDSPYILHDMKNDPHQTRDVSAEYPEVVAELNGYLTEWRQEQILRGGVPDPMELMVKEGPFLYYTPEEMLDRLRRTNRGHLAAGFVDRTNRYHPGRIRL